MPEVVKLTPDYDAGIVEVLERLLAEARSGEIIGFGFVTEKTGGYTSSGWQRSPRCNGNSLMGAIGYLQHRFAQSMIEGKA